MFQTVPVELFHCHTDLFNAGPFFQFVAPAALDELPLSTSDEGIGRSSRFVAFVQLDDNLCVSANVMVGYATGEDLQWGA